MGFRDDADGPGSAETRSAACPSLRTKEDGRRRRHIMILGIVLLVGFLLSIPLALGGRGPFTGGAVAAVPAFLAFLVPGITGVTVIVVSRVANARFRSLVLISLGLVPFVVVAFYLNSGVQGSGYLSSAEKPSLLVFAILFNAGWAGLFAGSRARWYRPNSAWAYWVGVVGGFLYILASGLPLMPYRTGGPWMLLPLKLFAGGEALTATWFLVPVATTFVCAALCFVNGPSRKPDEACGRAGCAFALLISGSVIFVAVFAVVIAFASQSLARLLAVPVFLSYSVGFALLLPFGITDRLVGDA